LLLLLLLLVLVLVLLAIVGEGEPKENEKKRDCNFKFGPLTKRRLDQKDQSPKIAYCFFSLAMSLAFFKISKPP
jgi:quinol-cytochrome oxidoreductase complex cytochrome b subunit